MERDDSPNPIGAVRSGARTLALRSAQASVFKSSLHSLRFLWCTYCAPENQNSRSVLNQSMWQSSVGHISFFWDLVLEIESPVCIGALWILYIPTCPEFRKIQEKACPNVKKPCVLAALGHSVPQQPGRTEGSGVWKTSTPAWQSNVYCQSQADGLDRRAATPWLPSNHNSSWAKTTAVRNNLTKTKQIYNI